MIRCRTFHRDPKRDHNFENHPCRVAKFWTFSSAAYSELSGASASLGQHDIRVYDWHLHQRQVHICFDQCKLWQCTRHLVDSASTCKARAVAIHETAPSWQSASAERTMSSTASAAAAAATEQQQQQQHHHQQQHTAILPPPPMPLSL